ncbi:MAG: DNA repair protein RecO [Clostridiales bacterium GWF2_38_85]|nr:MAG: DNA repair protein RecO [Clostridiales bacterium GWF2_38_85]HBL84076.1 DNA repair protein RecO [Clostridiales bacterium]
MYFNVQGIVIKEKAFSESSKHLTVLTQHRGVLYVTAKGVRKLSSKSFALSQLFACSDITLYGNGPTYTLTDGKLIENFYNLRNDAAILSLACYFCDVAAAVSTVTDEETEQYRLLLNTLWLLQSKPELSIFIKAVFELRIMFGIGYLPEFNCSECGNEIFEGYFNGESGEMFCNNCIPQNTYCFGTLNKEIVRTLKHIAISDLKKLYSFTVTDDILKQLSTLAEKYLCYRIENCHNSLNYYKSIL